jgi:hypothetical protein
MTCEASGGLLAFAKVMDVPATGLFSEKAAHRGYLVAQGAWWYRPRVPRASAPPSMKGAHTAMLGILLASLGRA